MTKPLRIVLMGYGKMGRAIENIARIRGHVIVQVFTSENPAIEPNLFPPADVIIEFTRPESVFGNLEVAIESGIPVITGTTGWLDRMSEIEKRCRELNGTFLYSSNFSIGMNMFFEINKVLARLMNKIGGYEASMEERHHIHKKDKPSGTAITLARQIIDESSVLSQWTIGQNKSNSELPIRVVREGDLKGYHSVEYRSEVDSIKIEHEAFSREGFALGAVLVAEWIADRKGVFQMEDFIQEVLRN